MDMNGEVLHEWSLDTGKEWGHVRLLSNGDLLVLSEGPRKFLRLDWDSNVIWERDVEAHHDVDIAENGDLYVLTGEDQSVDYDGTAIPIRNEFILILSPDGRTKRRIALLTLFRHLLNFEKIARFVETDGRVGEGLRFEGGAVDVFHVNTLSITARTQNEFFGEGRVLVAVRSLNRIAVIDLEAEKVVWSWGENDLDWPHQPVLLESGNLLIFDNGNTAQILSGYRVRPDYGGDRMGVQGRSTQVFLHRVEGRHPETTQRKHPSRRITPGSCFRNHT